MPEYSTAATLAALDDEVTACHACPRLVRWREEVAQTKRAAFADQEYWGRPVPGFGPPDARLAIVGLAPAAHGANRTGRMFTGDRSGDVLYAALHAVGLASQPEATHRDDGLQLFGTRITAPVRCAPPANKPTPAERDTCRPWLARELELLAPKLRAIVVLGAFGWQALLPVLADAGWSIPRPRPRFAHAAHVSLQPAGAAGPQRDGGDGDGDGHGGDSDGDALRPTRDGDGHAVAADRRRHELQLFGCFHVSQQNTFTGKLTPAMLEDVLRAAKDAAGLDWRAG